MSKISVIAKLTAADGKRDELRERLLALVAAADEEPGLELYSLHTSTDDPNVFQFFELYDDQAAFDVHGKGDAMRAAMGALGGLLAGRPEISMLSPIAAKGLDV